MVYTYMIQGKPATWGMLRFEETNETPMILGERELRKLAGKDAKAEEAEMWNKPGQSGKGIAKLRMALFEEWLKIQKQYKKEYGAAGNGEYILRSIVPPDFASQASLIPGIGALTLDGSTRGQEQQIVNGRTKQGKKAGQGRPDLDFKSMQNPNARKAKGTWGRLQTYAQGAIADIREDTLDTCKKDGKRRVS